MWHSPDIEHHVKRMARRIETDPIEVLADYRCAIEGLERLERLREGCPSIEAEPIVYSIEPAPMVRTTVR